jgi:hypothetical protein
LKSKAKFQNVAIAQLILYRAIVTVAFLGLIYYFAIVIHKFSLLYVFIYIFFLVVFSVLDRQISKKSKEVVDK